MTDAEAVCGETWDHEYEYAYHEDGTWSAVCSECGAETWGNVGG